MFRRYMVTCVQALQDSVRQRAMFKSNSSDVIRQRKVTVT